jgi:hypothetical protein
MANLSNINGKFVVEQTTGYVGIGTTDPNYPIEVLNASAEIALNSTSGSIYRLRSTSGDSFMITKNGVGDRLVIDGSGNSTFSGKILVGTGATAAASLNAFTQTVSANLYSALRIIENTGASSYWDIGATNGASTILNFYHNGTTTPKITFTHTGGATFAGDVHLSDTILGLRSTNDYAIQYRDLDFRFIGSADGTTQRKFSFGYYPSDNPAGTWNGKVYINSYSGDVGIGTDSPSQKLDVQGNVNINGTVVEEGSGNNKTYRYRTPNSNSYSGGNALITFGRFYWTPAHWVDVGPVLEVTLQCKY